MVKKVVSIEELIDLAIGTPESAVNFFILQKVLKLISRHCCKMNSKFEIDMDNMRAEISAIGNDSGSSLSESQESFASNVDSEHSKANNEAVEGDRTEMTIQKNSESDYKEDQSRVKTEKDEHEYSTDQKMLEAGIEKQKQSEGHYRNYSDKDDGANEKEEQKKKQRSDSHRKQDESRKNTSKHRKRSSVNVRKKDSDGNKRNDPDSTKNRIENLTKAVENRTNDLENQLKILTDRMESITQTMTTHLDEKNLAEINDEIDKLKKNMENTTDQCYEVTVTVNDQSSQIQEILSTINNIQLRKVENEELIDLLSGKADHSFVSEKVSTSQFEEIIQELNDVINESSMQMDSIRQETYTSLHEIKQDMLTKLLAEEFDAAKTKIYKELIKLTEQHALILAQQNEHVAAGAKMRNLNCFACNSEVVMLLEEETIPKFRGLKSSLQPLEPLVGSKIIISKNDPEWKNHQLKAKDFTRTSKAFRFHSDVSYEKSTYVKGKNGCMYKGNVGCDCVEGMTDAKLKRGKCCDMVEANNMKNISKTNKMNSDSNQSKIMATTEIGDIDKSSTKIDIVNNLQKITTNHIVAMEADVEPTIEITVKLEPIIEAPDENQAKTNILANSNITETELEIKVTTSTENTAANVETTGITENNPNTDVERPIDGNVAIKPENEIDSAIRLTDVPIETNENH